VFVALLANPALAKEHGDDDDDKGGSSGSSSSNSTAGTPGQSTFVSPDKAVAFGFTVPSVQNDDIYFTLRVPIGVSWGAVGLGSETMKGPLVLMIYVCSPSRQFLLFGLCVLSGLRLTRWTDE
jgi:hypothetical protein